MVFDKQSNGRRIEVKSRSIRSCDHCLNGLLERVGPIRWYPAPIPRPQQDISQNCETTNTRPVQCVAFLFTFRLYSTVYSSLFTIMIVNKLVNWKHRQTRAHKYTYYLNQWCKQDQILKTKTKTKITRPRPRSPEVNKGTRWIFNF